MSGAWSNDLTTSLILPTGATPPDQRIVLDGASDTILVYDSVGALIASVAATAGNDGLGNNYPAGISATSGIVSQSIILLYNGTPTLGNLVVSLANAAGSDTFGNNYAAGFNFYNGSATTYAQDLSGNIIVGPIAGSNIKLNPSNGTNTLQCFDSAGKLAFNINTTAGQLQVLDNTNLSAIVQNPGVVTNLTAGGIAFPAISSAGTQPTATQLGNAGRVGLNGVGGGTNLLSPAPTSTGRRSVVRAGNVVGATANPYVEVLSTTGDAQANLLVYGNVFANNIQTGSFQIPSASITAGVWTNDASIGFGSTFPSVPAVVLTPSAGGPGAGGSVTLFWTASAISTTGFNFRMMRSNTTATTFNWIAIST